MSYQAELAQTIKELASARATIAEQARKIGELTIDSNSWRELSNSQKAYIAVQTARIAELEHAYFITKEWAHKIEARTQEAEGALAKLEEWGGGVRTEIEEAQSALAESSDLMLKAETRIAELEAKVAAVERERADEWRKRRDVEGQRDVKSAVCAELRDRVAKLEATCIHGGPVGCTEPTHDDEGDGVRYCDRCGVAEICRNPAFASLPSAEGLIQAASAVVAELGLAEQRNAVIPKDRGTGKITIAIGLLRELRSELRSRPTTGGSNAG